MDVQYEQGQYLRITLQYGCQGLCPFRAGMRDIAISLRHIVKKKKDSKE